MLCNENNFDFIFRFISDDLLAKQKSLILIIYIATWQKQTVVSFMIKLKKITHFFIQDSRLVSCVYHDKYLHKPYAYNT